MEAPSPLSLLLFRFVVVSIGVSWVVWNVFFGFLFHLVAGEDAEVITEGVSGGDAGVVDAAGGFAGSGEDHGAFEVTGMGSVVETAFGPKSLAGEADTGFFSPFWGDFLFFLDTLVQPPSVLG